MFFQLLEQGACTHLKKELKLNQGSITTTMSFSWVALHPRSVWVHKVQSQPFKWWFQTLHSGSICIK